MSDAGSNTLFWTNHYSPAPHSRPLSTMVNKKNLRKRWKDEKFLSSFEFPRDRIPKEKELQDIDLRGVPKLALGKPLWEFKISEVNSKGLDFSFGDGCLGIYSSRVQNMKCIDFKFDRASTFFKSEFTECDFSEARLRLDLTSCEFHNCIFNDSKFAGGLNEYGFTRCKFENCSFSNIKWERTYFKACTFISCDFSSGRIIDSAVLSFKYKGCKNFSRNIFSGKEEPRLIEIG